MEYTLFKGKSPWLLLQCEDPPDGTPILIRFVAGLSKCPRLISNRPPDKSILQVLRFEFIKDEEGDPLFSSFSQLKDVLNNISELEEVEPNAFLSPFLEVIRSEDTTGPITGLALTSVNKFLSYGLVDPKNEVAAPAIENIADAVTHARFVGTDPGSDEVVLMKILHVLRTLLLSPAGVLLTNESVCEIMQSCFRICFEMRLSELLRKSAEHTLMDMVQLLFSRLPQFKEDPKWSANMKKLKMRTGGVDPSRMWRKKRSPKPKQKKAKQPTTLQNVSPVLHDTHEKVPVPVSISEEMIGDNREGDKRTELSKEDEEMAISKDLAEEVDKVNEQSISEEMIGDNRKREGDKRTGLNKEDEGIQEEVAISKDLVGKVNKVNRQIEETEKEGTGSGQNDEDQALKDEIAYVHANRESIATTPVEGTSIIDIHKGFQAASNQDDAFEHSGHSELEVPSETGDQQGEQLSRNASQTDLKEHISLTIPGDGDLVRSASELSLPSEPGEDVESSQSFHGSAQSLQSGQETMDGGAKDDYVNPRGVRFIPHQHVHEGSAPLIPYGLPCVRELFRFLISLTNPLDRHNTDVMIHMGLSLLTVALESGADHIGQFNSLIYLVKDDMCRHLFLLVQSERLSLMAASLRLCFLLFESMRRHLKLQLEMYLTRLCEMITSDHPRITYEMREIALESIVQLWRIPGLVTELYLNYDCDLYCSNLFEELTKLLSKNAFLVAGLFSTHLLSLDALLTVVDSIEQHCHSRILNTPKHEPEPKQENAFPVAGLFSTHLLSLDALLTVVDSIEQHCHSRILNTPKHEPEPKQEAKDQEPSGEGAAQTPEGDGETWDKMVGPPTTGFGMAQRILQSKTQPHDQPKPVKTSFNRKGPQIKPNRMKVIGEIPSNEELLAIKQKKRIYHTGTEYFNNKPAKGVTYLQEQGLLSDPLDPGEIITFIKENPKLDKKMIGEYITKRTNSVVLEAFVKSFHFEDLRIDEALRIYLEAFRLPGEAPVISLVLEHFADHWHKSNGEPFFNADAAFTLAYAVIMLNVDQHNHNVKKQNVPMKVEDFKVNLRKTNGGEDFEEEMLEEIYNAIRSDEIVMPSEHTGIVKENYLWKVLLKRGGTKEGFFTHCPTGIFDHDLFTLIWGPTVAALSFVFDKSSDEAIISKAISGFRKCAMISAHYGMSDVFDNLVISLCKFTTLLSSAEAPENIPIAFGINMKAQLAARTVFGLAHRHGDILREGWKNILDCMLQLFRAKLLPKCMIEVEDFVHPSGKICLIKEESPANQKSESGVLSSLYSYFATETANTKGPTPEEQEATKIATKCIHDCHLEQLINDSKFLREESLHELVKALIFASQGPDAHDSMGTVYDEDAAVFFFEQFIKCVLQNRDRINPVWQSVREHIYGLVANSTQHTFLVERVVVGLLRISIRLLRREEIAPQVLTSLQILLMIKPKVIHSISQQIAYGLHDLLRTNAANIHSGQDWYTLFVLLEVVGAGANPPPLMQVNAGVDVAEGLSEAGAQSDSELPSGSVMTDGCSDRGYTSDSELETRPQSHLHRGPSGEFEVQPVPENGSWMLVNKDEPAGYKKHMPVNQFSIELSENVQLCDSKALLKSSETLSFLVRDAAHVTPLNFESCVHAIRAFAEASLNGGCRRPPTPQRQVRERKGKTKLSKKQQKMKKSASSPSQLHSANSSDEEEAGEGTDAELHSLSIQLLDLMHTLHTRANSIYTSWAEEGGSLGTKDTESEGIEADSESLWVKCWCPLLQGIARLCCDARRQVRGQALTYLQRALLVHDLQTLSAVEWEACFNKILFPLLTKLLENINQSDPSGMEETRMRASTLLCKVFLQHLSPLLSLSTFTALWLTILDFMDKYMHVDRSDLLTEAIPESLKNMLLVMDTAGIFQTGDGTNSQLWRLTWDRIGTFLPHLKEELFKTPEPEPQRPAMDRDAEEPTEATSESSPLVQQPAGSQSPVPSSTTVTDPSSNQESAEQADPESASPSNPDSCLATEASLPTASSYFLHTPLPDLGEFNNIGPDSSVAGTSVAEETPENVQQSAPGGEPVQLIDAQPILLSNTSAPSPIPLVFQPSKIHDI